MNNIKNIINICKSALGQIITLGILFTFLYFRFIKERTTGPINTEFTIIKCSIYILIITIYCYILFKTINNKETTNKIIQVLQKCQMFYKTALSDIYFLLLWLLGTKYIRLVEKLTITVYNVPSKTHKYILYGIKQGIPTIIVLCFFVETCIQKSIKYFPYSILLMGIYILYELIIYIILYHINRFIYECENFYFEVTFDTDGDIERILLPDGETSTLPPDIYITLHDNFWYFQEEYIKYKKKYIYFFDNYENLINPVHKQYGQIFRLILGLITWIYLLVLILI